MRINNVLSKSAYTKAFIVFNYIISKSNLAINASNIYKDFIAKVVALVNNS